MMRRRCTCSLAFPALALAAAWLWPVAATAQFFDSGRRSRSGDDVRNPYYDLNRTIPERDIFPGNVFTFCRIQYGSASGFGRGGGWATDYSDSDRNFSQRLSELTTIEVNRDENGTFKHAVVRLTDPELYNYPFIYIVEPGRMSLNRDEAANLRSYLLRGGFLLVDDFWGDAAWANFEYEFSQALDPKEYPIVDLPLEHPIFHCVFKLDEIPQVPSIGVWSRYGVTYEGGYDTMTPHIRGVFDTHGRLMAVIAHNTDLGDGWEEEAVNPDYFRELSAKKAYPMGINIIVYAMTH